MNLRLLPCLLPILVLVACAGPAAPIAPVPEPVPAPPVAALPAIPEPADPPPPPPPPSTPVEALTVQQAQERLNQLGYSAGKADGFVGPKTRAALRQFQKRKGLKITGVLDDATAAQLADH